MKRIILLAALLAAQPAFSADKLKIGFISTLSGPSASVGIDLRDGFNLAIKMNGGKLGGLPVEMLIGDDQMRPEVGKQLAERYVRQDRVDIVTGVAFSTVLGAIVPEVVNADRFFIEPNAGISRFAGAGCHPNLFFTAWPTEAYAEAAGQYMSSKGIKSVAFLAPDFPGGRDTATGLKRYYRNPLATEIYTKLGQLDYSVEIAQIRAAKPEVAYVFLPGGMGINFIKQFVAAGASSDIQLVLPMWGSDQDTTRAVGDALLGVFSVGHWSLDFTNPANLAFVKAFEAEYKRLPTSYAASSFDAGVLIDSAVRKVKGKIEDKKAFRDALRAADFKSVRGEFKFQKNHFPQQDYFLQVASRRADGRIGHKTIGTIFKAHGDSYAQDCKMK